MKRDEVLAEIFGGEVRAVALAARCDAWMTSSPRFAAFMEAHRTKIRKKVRTAEGVEGLYDLLRELEVAHHLLEQRGAIVAYESYAADKARGPDFTVTLKGHIPCNVEVKRLRAGSRTLEARLIDAVCQKLRQMPPSVPNLLWLVLEEAKSPLPATLAVAETMKQLIQRAEQKDQSLFGRHGYADARAFFAQFLRLSAVLAYPTDATHRELWRNPQARHPLPPEMVSWLARADRDANATQLCANRPASRGARNAGVSGRHSPAPESPAQEALRHLR